jgi:hypothetical protein
MQSWRSVGRVIDDSPGEREGEIDHIVRDAYVECLLLAGESRIGIILLGYPLKPMLHFFGRHS